MTRTTSAAQGFSADERAAIKRRAAELRAEGKKGAKKAERLQALLDGIASMTDEDRRRRARARGHQRSGAGPPAPDLVRHAGPRERRGQGGRRPQDSGKFGQRYSILEFQDSARLDDGDVWPVSFAIFRWSPEVEKKVAELITTAVG